MPNISRTHRALPALLGWAAFGLLLSTPAAQGSDFVTVRAWADPGYLAQEAALTGPKHETYVVAQGEYFDGTYRDPSVSKDSLGAILRFLAPTLTKQGYYPAKDMKTAEQLVVVHWGTTTGYMANDYVQTENSLADTRPQFHVASIDSGPLPPTLQASSSGLVMPPDYTYDHYDAAIATNAAAATAQSMTVSSAEGLLGYAKVLFRERKKLMASDLQEILEANLHDDRYFVILQAYDFHQLQRGEGRKLLWSVHMSIRAPGLNFTLALPRMGQVASDAYGQSNDDVVMGKAQLGRNASVEVGPVTVLSESTPAAQKK